jgi:AraC family transcriptional regulator
MTATTLLESGGLSVIAYHCDEQRGARPFAEEHRRHSLSYVRTGSFGCKTVAGAFELAAGSVLVGHPGDEYTCTHDHAEGDRCFSFQFTPELVEAMGAPRTIWRRGSIEPLPELMVLGGLAEAALANETDLGLCEIGLLFASRVFEVVSDRAPERPVKDGAQCRRAVRAALLIEEHATEPLDLEAAAREAGLSSFHFLRSFAAVFGVTPHQYLLRCRLRRAAELLTDPTRPVTEVASDVGFNDLSNFVRTFRRASGVSPGAFRKASQGERTALSSRFLHLTALR